MRDLISPDAIWMAIEQMAAMGFGFVVRVAPIRHLGPIGKLASKRPSYRYHPEDIRNNGLVATPIRKDFTQLETGVHQPYLSPQAVIFLTELRSWTQQRGIELVYTLLVSYVPEKYVSEQRAANQKFLAEIATIIPVWQDEYLGAWPVATDFADTTLHMTEGAARIRTRALGKMRF